MPLVTGPRHLFATSSLGASRPGGHPVPLVTGPPRHLLAASSLGASRPVGPRQLLTTSSALGASCHPASHIASGPAPMPLLVTGPRLLASSALGASQTIRVSLVASLGASQPDVPLLLVQTLCHLSSALVGASRTIRLSL